ALERDVDAEVLPGQLGGVALGRDLDGAVADADGVALDGDLAGEAAVHAVVAQQMRVGLDRPEIVDADHLDILAARLGDRAQDIAADAAKSVDPDPDGHFSAPLAPAVPAAAICLFAGAEPGNPWRPSRQAG